MKVHKASGAAMAFTILAIAARAFAHAFPDSSQPPAGSVLSSPPPAIQVHFDHPIDPVKSRVRVLDANGENMAASQDVAGADKRSISVPLKPLPPGQYFVKWGLYSSDGDHTMGAFSFTVSGPAHQ